MAAVHTLDVLHNAEGRAMTLPLRVGDDWGHVRADIERLYVEENHTLKQVMQIMARDFGHDGSVKQYKQKIKLWDLRKNNKEQEAWAVIRKNTVRQTLRKASTFQMRGKAVDLEKVSKYFKRRGIANPEFEAILREVATPPGLMVWTPPILTPVRSPIPEPAETNDDQENHERGADLEQQFNLYNDMENSQQVAQALPIASHSMAQWHPEPHGAVTQAFDLVSYLAQSYHVRRSPLPPATLMVQESVLYHLKQYLHGAYNNGLYLQFEKSRLALVKSIRGDGDLGRFANLWTTGKTLMLDGDYVRGRRVFTRVSTILHDIIRDADPSALSHIIEMHFHLHLQLPQLADMLREYAADVAKKVYPERHPWRVLLVALAKMDQEHLTDGLNNAWLLTNSELRNTVGPWDPAYISALTGYYTSGILDGPDMKAQLRTLVQQGDITLVVSDERHLRLRCEYAWSLFHAGGFQDALSASSNVILQAWAAGSKGFEIDCLRLSATCHYRLGHAVLAESTMMEAITKLQACYGNYHPRGVRFITTLQGWLQAWGKPDEARGFDPAVEAILGPDEE